jgi:hypothetical protein
MKSQKGICEKKFRENPVVETSFLKFSQPAEGEKKFRGKYCRLVEISWRKKKRLSLKRKKNKL